MKYLFYSVFSASGNNGKDTKISPPFSKNKRSPLQLQQAFYGRIRIQSRFTKCTTSAIKTA